MNKAVRVITPSNGYIVLEPTEPEAKNRVYDVPTKEEIPRTGKVIAVSRFTYHVSGKSINCPVKVGDEIIHSAAGAETVKLGEKEFRICPFDRILGIIKK